MRTEVLQVKLTKDEKAKLFRLAAKRSMKTGQRISAGATLRELAMTELKRSESEPTAQEVNR